MYEEVKESLSKRFEDMLQNGLSQYFIDEMNSNLDRYHNELEEKYKNDNRKTTKFSRILFEIQSSSGEKINKYLNEIRMDIRLYDEATTKRVSSSFYPHDLDYIRVHYYFVRYCDLTFDEMQYLWDLFQTKKSLFYYLGLGGNEFFKSLVDKNKNISDSIKLWFEMQ